MFSKVCYLPLMPLCHLLHNCDKIEKAAMSDKYLDDYLSVIAIDVAVEEKTRIARMAVTTLHKLHNVMQQMRDWRDDSAKLKSNIWRMKMALRADDKNGNDNQRIDPLIVHQRVEISRLELTNGALENEVTSLKSALTKAEEDIARIAACEMGDKIATLENEFSSERERMSDEILRLKERLREAEEGETGVLLRRLRDKLNEFARGDRTIEIIFANAIGKTVEMIIGLSEELVNVSENLYRFKTKNRNLRLKHDRLKAMLRSRCGNSAEYRKRIGELNNLAEQLMGEMGRLRVIRENANYSESLDATDIPNVVKHIQRLMNDLRNNLKSDREAMIAAGDPDCLKYMKKVVSLKVNLKVLSVELRRSNVPMDKRLCENVQYEKCLEIVSLLNGFLQEIDSEIEKLKITPMNEYCKIGISGSRYMMKIAELEDTVKKSIQVITILRQAPSEIINTNEKITEALEDLIKRLCCKLKELEVFDDRANLRGRIEQLEALVMYLKSELLEKNEHMNALNDECASVRLILERDRKKYEKIIVDMREANETLRGDVKKGKQEISELSLKRDHFERRAAEMQLMKVEIDAAAKELQVLHDDKETLLGETERLRNALGERDKEIENIITQGDALKAALRAEIEDLKTKLEIASDENVKLRSIIEGLGKQAVRERLGKLKSSGKVSGGEERDNGEDRGRNLRDELEYLKAESNEPKISLNEADKRVGYSKSMTDKAVGDGGARPEGEISDLESNEQSLTYRLNVRTSAGEEASTGDAARVVMAEYKASENKVKQLEKEKEQLEKELSELRSEKGLLDRSMADANNKRAALQDQVNKFKSERNGLREKMSERETAARNLKLELERARAELEDAARLQAENSKVLCDLDTLSLRNIRAEDRVRVLLTEKNELATRINELNDESVALREQLNKVGEENEYFSMELNKSRVENDKAKAENTLLQVTCDARERDNAALRRERDDARGRINEIGNECRVLGNQLRIQRMKYEALRLAAAALHDENNDRKNYLGKIDTQHPLARDHERGFAGAHNEIKQKPNYPDITGTEVEIDERRDGGAEVKVESDTRVGHDNKTEIKDELKDELKRPKRSGNKALKLEQANLRSDNSEITMTDGKSEGPAAWTDDDDDEGIVGSTLKKFQIAGIWHKKGISNYSNYLGDPEMSEGNKRTAALDIDRLEAENRGPKMKADTARSSRNSCLADGEKTKADFHGAMGEIQALKLELMNLRDEKAALRSQLEIFKEELKALKSERVALKDELAASRKSNFDLRLKVNDLRGANEKLRETNAGLGSRPQDASTMAEVSEDRRLKNNFESALSDYLKKYIFTERNLQLTNRRNRFNRVSPRNPRLQSVEKNLRHIEGQKS